MPPKSVRYIPKKKVMDRLITAWATGDKAAHRAIFNSLSEHEKQYVRNMKFNMNNTKPLSANSAPFVPAVRVLNPNSPPFETMVERNALMADLAASGSKLPNWMSLGGKSRGMHKKNRKTRRRH